MATIAAAAVQAGATGATTTERPERLAPGTHVEVRTKLETRRWAKGFEVVDAQPSGYRLRRLSDGEIMPVVFPSDDVRAERKRSTWWY